MIFAGLIGACIAGGLTVALLVLSDVPFGRSVAATLSVAVAGAAVGVGAAALGVDDDPPGCSEGEVKAAPGNDLFQGCVPVELAEKQLER